MVFSFKETYKSCKQVLLTRSYLQYFLIIVIIISKWLSPLIFPSKAWRQIREMKEAEEEEEEEKGNKRTSCKSKAAFFVVPGIDKASSKDFLQFLFTSYVEQSLSNKSCPNGYFWLERMSDTHTNITFLSKSKRIDELYTYWGFFFSSFLLWSEEDLNQIYNFFTNGRHSHVVVICSS